MISPQHPQELKSRNPDMRYSLLERCELDITELIGAVDERSVDGMLSNADHAKYEALCAARGVVRAAIKEERESHNSPAAEPVPVIPPKCSCSSYTSCDECIAGARDRVKHIKQRAAAEEREKVLENICDNCGGLADGEEQCKTCYVEALRREGERR